ncbi:MAG: hypothetical protein ABSD68_01485 [Candidatus Micrarchaeales archaeon]|jgi:hypothetical protein
MPSLAAIKKQTYDKVSDFREETAGLLRKDGIHLETLKTICRDELSEVKEKLAGVSRKMSNSIGNTENMILDKRVQVTAGLMVLGGSAIAFIPTGNLNIVLVGSIITLTGAIVMTRGAVIKSKRKDV